MTTTTRYIVKEAPPKIIRTGCVVNQYISGELSGGDAISVQTTAVEAIGGHRVVAWAPGGGVMLADCDDIATAPFVCGVTTGAAEAGSPITVVLAGKITESSWAWSQTGLLFVGRDGALIEETPPSGAAYWLPIGVAAAAAIITVRIGTAIYL